MSRGFGGRGRGGFGGRNRGGFGGRGRGGGGGFNRYDTGPPETVKGIFLYKIINVVEKFSIVYCMAFNLFSRPFLCALLPTKIYIFYLCAVYIKTIPSSILILACL